MRGRGVDAFICFFIVLWDWMFAQHDLLRSELQETSVHEWDHIICQAASGLVSSSAIAAVSSFDRYAARARWARVSMSLAFCSCCSCFCA
jgi:hypothetical protein